MDETRTIVVAFTRCNAPPKQQEWSEWYDDSYLPELVRDGSPQVATHWELTQKPVPGMPSIGFSHVTIYELAGDDGEAQADALLARADALRAAGKTHPAHCVIGVDVLHRHGRAQRKPAPDASLRGHILAYVQCNDAARQREWDDWYDEVHLPDMMASHAFSAGTRWRRRDPARYGANDVTLYDVSGHSVEEAVEMSAAVMPGIAAAGRKLDCHVGGMTVTLRASGRHGGAGYR